MFLGLEILAVPCLLALAAAGCCAAQTTTGGAPALPDFDKLWNFSDPAGTEAVFRRLLEQAAPSEAAYRLELSTQIARCQGLQGKFDDAHATLDAVDRQLATDDLPVPRVRSLLERGRAFNSAGHADRALPLFRQALDLGTSRGLPRFAIDAAHMVAIAEPQVDDRIAWNLKCLELIDRHPEQDPWRNAIYNNLGEAYRAAGRYPEALDCFQKLIAWQKSTGRAVDRYARVDEAKMLRLIGQPAESLDRMTALQAEIGNEIDGFVAEERAEALLALHRADEARPLFRQAWSKLKEEAWLRDSEPARYERLKRLGE